MRPRSVEPLVEVNDVVRRVVAARVRDRHLVEDLTQETLVRVAAASSRLGPDETRAYAIVTARNLVASHARAESVRGRHAHRLVDYRGFDGPEELVLERDETDALAGALQRLDADERALLLRHEADGASIDRIAEETGSTAGSIRMRLARGRATLRVDFLLAFRRVTLPTHRCRSVLLALSSGDRRRQRILDAAGHLVSCSTCAELARPVTERNRGIAAWLILPAAEAVRRATNALRRNPAPAATAAAVAVAVAATAGFFFTRPDDRAASPAVDTAESADPAMVESPSTITFSAQTVATVPTSAVSATSTPAPATTGCPQPVALDEADPGTLVNCPFAPTVVTPLDVSADEGFWAATVDRREIWIHLTGVGESPVDVRPGEPITIAGTVSAPAPDPASMGLPAAGDPRVAATGYYLDVDFGSVTVG